MFLTWKTTTLLDITDIHTNGLQSVQYLFLNTSIGSLLTKTLFDSIIIQHVGIHRYCSQIVILYPRKMLTLH